MVERGIFSTPGKAWVAVAVYTVFLYSTLTLAFDIYVYFFDWLGKPFLSSFMFWMYAPVGLALLGFMWRRLPRRPETYLAFGLIGLALAYCLSILEVPAKRFHFLQYGILTVLAFDALRFKFRDRYLYLWTMAFVSLVGFGDECVQWMLPDRYFGINDVVLNAGAGLLMLAFLGFVIGDSYPWGGGRSDRGAAP
ncbi:MAG: VanZ family protein [Acidobacteriota bacterium]